MEDWQTTYTNFSVCTCVYEKTTLVSFNFMFIPLETREAMGSSSSEREASEKAEKVWKSVIHAGGFRIVCFQFYNIKEYSAIISASQKQNLLSLQASFP